MLARNDTTHGEHVHATLADTQGRELVRNNGTHDSHVQAAQPRYEGPTSVITCAGRVIIFVARASLVRLPAAACGAASLTAGAPAAGAAATAGRVFGFGLSTEARAAAMAAARLQFGLLTPAAAAGLLLALLPIAALLGLCLLGGSTPPEAAAGIVSGGALGLEA
jgi:hypothetical protein